MRITERAARPDALRAAGRLSLMAEGFGGGTDIGGRWSNSPRIMHGARRTGARW